MDRRISELPLLIEADLRGPDLLPLADVSASETKHITTAALFKQGMQILPPGSIPGDRLVSNSVTALELAPDSVTDSELADNACDTAAIQDLACTNSKIAPGVDGAKITDDTLTASKIDASSFDRGLDKAGGRIGITNSVGAGGVSGITWNRQGLITGGARLQPNDLPIATAADVGGISVPANSGLVVSAAGAIDHVTLTVAGSMSGITYDEHGHISNAVRLQPSDLPVASNTLIGGVFVPVSGELQINGFGSLTHVDSPVVPGVYPKVTVDQKGHVTLGQALAQDDIPDINASKIININPNGDPVYLNPTLIEDRSITMDKLADKSVTYIQEPQPPITGVPDGAFWYQESTAGLHLFNHNSWMPVSIGRLSQENLRYCGTIDATTGLINGTTLFGTAAGYKVGDQPQVATDPHTGVYFVVQTAGNSIGVTPGFTYDAGDWLLCNGAATGWTRIDTLSGAGGSGATYLNDLLDVDSTQALPSRDAADNKWIGLDPISGIWKASNEINGGIY